MTYLEAINKLLAMIGTGVVSNVDRRHPDVNKADALLTEHKRSLLKGGRWFNKAYGVAYEPDPDGYITLPDNVLSFELTNARDGRMLSRMDVGASMNTGGQYPKLALRDRRLYDGWRNTYMFDTAVTLNVYTNMNWDDMPDCAQRVACYYAGSELIENELNDVAKSRRMETRGDNARAEMVAQELREDGPNMFDNQKAAYALSGRRPRRR